MWLEVVQLLMKNRTRNYGRNFCGNVEMECIVNGALTSWVEYRAKCRVSKLKAHNSNYGKRVERK